MAITSAQVDAAISAVLTNGQSYQLDGLTYTAADLDALQRLRHEAAAAERATAKKIFQRVRFGRVQ